MTNKPIFVGKNYTENQFNTGHNIHICNRRGFLLRRQFSGSRKFCAGSELKTAQELGIETLVAIPDISSASMAPDHAYNVCEFSFNAEQNCYTCPQGHTLITNGNWYKKDRNGPGRKYTAPIRVQHFKTPACKTCPVVHLCTKNPKRGRVIERSEFAPYIEQNRINLEQKEHLYKRRQAIAEHPFGIIKRQWGFYYISTKKGMDKAAADVGLIFTAFNLRRLFNIPGKSRLEGLLASVFALFEAIRHHVSPKKLNNAIVNQFFIFGSLSSKNTTPLINCAI